MKLIHKLLLLNSGAPAISVSPSIWDFGATPVGTPVSKEFTISNTGTGTLEITLPITTPAGYTVTVDPATSVAPGASTTFTLRFDASVDADGYDGNISIVNNSSENPKLVPVTASTIVDVVDAAFNYVPFDIIRSADGLAPESAWNIRTHANISVTKTYYLNTVTGNDGNSGITNLLPKKTWNAIIGTGDYDRIIIQDGSYLIRSESSLQSSRNLEVIGEGTVYFTSSRANNLGAWSLAPAQTNTYQSTVAGGEFISRVFDEDTLDAFGNPTPLVSRASIALVEANAGSYYWVGGVLYVHTFDSTDPTGQSNLRYYDSNAVSWTKDNLKFYFENINFRGGVRFLNASAAGTATKVYLNACTGHAVTTCNGISEFIVQDCEFFSSVGDGINYDIANTIVTNAIEINCEIYGGGADGTNQSSTLHNGCKALRLGGNYHHMTGQLCAEAGATSKAWLLDCLLNNSSIANVGYYTEGTSWLDTCTISNVTTALQEAGAGDIRIRNLTSNGVYIGTPTAY